MLGPIRLFPGGFEIPYKLKFIGLVNKFHYAYSSALI